MKKIYEWSDCRIGVDFRDKLIRIHEPEALERYLSTDLVNRSAILVKYIKMDYAQLMKQELDITDDSMIVEIWGHVYASYLAKGIKNLVQLNMVDNVADFVLKRSDIIDCGESEIDSNRKFWDIIARFKGVILKFLPNEVK